MFELRDYQEEAVKVILETEVGDPRMIVIPTGGGKTIIFSQVAVGAEGRVLIVVPSGELREQTVLKLKKFNPNIDVGSVQAKLDDVGSKIVVATWQSLTHKKSKRLEVMRGHGEFEYIIFDEVHLAVDRLQRIIDKLNDCKVCGLTATPWNKKLYKMFNGVAYSKDIMWMIENDYLCEPLCYKIDSKTVLDDVGIKNDGEFKVGELEQAVNNIDRNQLIVESYLKYAMDRLSTLVFATGIEHIKSLVEEFKKQGIYCKGLSSKDDKEYRKAVIEEFKNGKLPVLVNCGILTTGFDYERMDCLIFARPTASKILFVQCLGRGLRIHPEKQNCLVIDVHDILTKYDICDMEDVFGVGFQSGETLKEAQERKEKEEEEVRKSEEEAERIRQEQIELDAQRIDLLGSLMRNTFANRDYDWFKVDSDTYALQYAYTQHYVVKKSNNYYIHYDMNTDKHNYQSKPIKTSNDLEELVESIEIAFVFNENPFIVKNANWKKEPATEKQLAVVPDAKTKWDAATTLNGRNIQSLLKKTVISA